MSDYTTRGYGAESKKGAQGASLFISRCKFCG